MMTDAQAIFVPISSPLTMSTGTGGATATPWIDLLGQGVGTAPVAIIGTTALFGMDWGIGKQQLELIATVSTAFTTGTAATLTAQFQVAPDTGSAGGYNPGTPVTLLEQPGIAAANLGLGATFARFDWPPVIPLTLRPRFARMNFVAAAATSFTAGAIGFAGVVLCRDDQANRQAAKNFAVA